MSTTSSQTTTTTMAPALEPAMSSNTLGMAVAAMSGQHIEVEPSQAAQRGESYRTLTPPGP
jgi:hypothetical protein